MSFCQIGVDRTAMNAVGRGDEPASDLRLQAVIALEIPAPEPACRSAAAIRASFP